MIWPRMSKPPFSLVHHFGPDQRGILVAPDGDRHVGVMLADVEDHIGPDQRVGIDACGVFVERTGLNDAMQRRQKRRRVAHGDEERHRACGKQVSQRRRIDARVAVEHPLLEGVGMVRQEILVREHHPLDPLGFEDRGEKNILRVFGGGRAVELAKHLAQQRAIPACSGHDDAMLEKTLLVFQERLDQPILVGAMNAEVDGHVWWLHGVLALAVSLSGFTGQYSGFSSQLNRI